MKRKTAKNKSPWFTSKGYLFPRKKKPVKVKPKVLTALLGVLLLGGSQGAWAEPDYEALADAIRKAEGNANYGVLTKYKHTTPRQACINTCRNQWKRHQAHKCGKAYLTCLRDRYCPIGAKNDPKNLNINWLRNVSRLYGRTDY